MAVLVENHYGKSRVRVVKVTRHADHHDVHEWSVGVYLTGDFEDCYVVGDNSGVVATDTMKNMVYVVARTSEATAMEGYALELAEFIRGRNPQLTSVRVTVEEKMWTRLKVDGGKHPSAFLQRGPEVSTTSVTVGQDGTQTVMSGVKGLVILKTGDSGFEGFDRDELTTLPETADRLLGTEATIEWTYGAFPQEPAKVRFAVMDTLLRTFAGHKSLSVQHTLYAMAEAALGAHAELTEIGLTMPNRHNIPVDLGRLGMDWDPTGPHTIFVPMDEPHGHIHARLTR